MRLLEREQRKLEEIYRRGFTAKWSREPGWISFHDHWRMALCGVEDYLPAYRDCEREP